MGRRRVRLAEVVPFASVSDDTGLANDRNVKRAFETLSRVGGAHIQDVSPALRQKLLKNLDRYKDVTTSRTYRQMRSSS